MPTDYTLEENESASPPQTAASGQLRKPNGRRLKVRYLRLTDHYRQLSLLNFPIVAFPSRQNCGLFSVSYGPGKSDAGNFQKVNRCVVSAKSRSDSLARVIRRGSSIGSEPAGSRLDVAQAHCERNRQQHQHPEGIHVGDGKMPATAPAVRPKRSSEELCGREQESVGREHHQRSWRRT